MGHHGPIRSIATAACLVAALAACGTSRSPAAGPPAPAVSVSAGFRADPAAWSLPLDAYLVDERRLAHAQDILYTGCMRAGGHPVPAFDIADYLPPNRNKVLRVLFDSVLAAHNGYHSGPTKQDPRQRPRPDLSAPDTRHADQQCMKTAADRLGIDKPGTALVEQLASNAETAARSDPGTASAATRWRACMSPLHLPDLPPSPAGMPTPVQRAAFGLTRPADPGPGELPQPTQPTPEEIRQAVTDAGCRQSSGFDAALYGSEIRDQQALIDENRGQLSTVLAAQQRCAQAVADVVGS